MNAQHYLRSLIVSLLVAACAPATELESETAAVEPCPGGTPRACLVAERNCMDGWFGWFRSCDFQCGACPGAPSGLGNTPPPSAPIGAFLPAVGDGLYNMGTGLIQIPLTIADVGVGLWDLGQFGATYVWTGGDNPSVSGVGWLSSLGQCVQHQSEGGAGYWEMVGNITPNLVANGTTFGIYGTTMGWIHYAETGDPTSMQQAAAGQAFAAFTLYAGEINGTITSPNLGGPTLGQLVFGTGSRPPAIVPGATPPPPGTNPAIQPGILNPPRNPPAIKPTEVGPTPGTVRPNPSYANISQGDALPVAGANELVIGGINQAGEIVAGVEGQVVGMPNYLMGHPTLVNRIGPPAQLQIGFELAPEVGRPGQFIMLIKSRYNNPPNYPTVQQILSAQRAVESQGVPIGIVRFQPNLVPPQGAAPPPVAPPAPVPVIAPPGAAIPAPLLLLPAELPGPYSPFGPHDEECRPPEGPSDLGARKREADREEEGKRFAEEEEEEERQELPECAPPENVEVEEPWNMRACGTVSALLPLPAPRLPLAA